MLKKLFFEFIDNLGYELRNKKYLEKVQRSKLKWLQDLDIQIVIDVGANEGQFAKYIHEILPQAWIYSFEPLQDCFEKLIANLEGVPNFKAFNFALGDEVGESIIYRNQFSQSSSLLPMLESHQLSFPFSSTEGIQEKKIRILRLDDFENELEIEKPLLIKVDVQGFEAKVIEGGSKLLGKAKVLIIEMSTVSLYDGQLLFDDLYRMIKSLGFKYQGNFGQMYSAEDGRIVQLDAFFVRP